MLTQRECAVRRRSLRRSRGIHFRVSDILVLGEAQVSVIKKDRAALFDYPADTQVAKCAALYSMVIILLDDSV